MMLFWIIVLLVIGIALLRLLPVDSPCTRSSRTHGRDNLKRNGAEGGPTDGQVER